jgi:hypothetical protein
MLRLTSAPCATPTRGITHGNRVSRPFRRFFPVPTRARRASDQQLARSGAERRWRLSAAQRVQQRRRHRDHRRGAGHPEIRAADPGQGCHPSHRRRQGDALQRQGKPPSPRKVGGELRPSDYASSRDRCGPCEGRMPRRRPSWRSIFRAPSATSHAPLPSPDPPDTTQRSKRWRARWQNRKRSK